MNKIAKMSKILQWICYIQIVFKNRRNQVKTIVFFHSSLVEFMIYITEVLIGFILKYSSCYKNNKITIDFNERPEASEYNSYYNLLHVLLIVI